MQCDQMDKIFAQYLDVYNDENLPHHHKNFTKVCSIFCQVPSKVHKHGENLPNLVAQNRTDVLTKKMKRSPRLADQKIFYFVMY